MVAAVHSALLSSCRQISCSILPSDWTVAADSGGPSFWSEGLTGGQQRMAELMRISQGTHLTRHSSIKQHAAPGGFHSVCCQACLPKT